MAGSAYSLPTLEQSVRLIAEFGDNSRVVIGVFRGNDHWTTMGVLDGDDAASRFAQGAPKGLQDNAGRTLVSAEHLLGYTTALEALREVVRNG